MIVNLLLGLPGSRPGGLVLTVLFFIGAGLLAVGAGLIYGALCQAFPRASVPLQGATALLRGIPLLLLLFFLVQTSALPVAAVGLVALLLYSFSYVGEILRSFLVSYPKALAQQAQVMGVEPVREWLQLRVPWVLASGLEALGTHWISLLKDTGALVVLGIGELTSVAKVLSETTASYDRWITVLAAAAGVYLAATFSLIHALHRVRHLGFARGLG
jgi:ABC-type amino acid transport system permease subunit